MSDRRSHWDTDLVDGVGRRLIPRYRSIGYCTDAERHRIYTLIEFVEDWQDRTQQARAMSMTDNEAAIARVRELHTPVTLGARDICLACSVLDVCANDERWIVRVPYPCATIRALGGDA